MKLKEMKLDPPRNQESRDSTNSKIIPIFAGYKFRTLRAMLIGGNSELISGIVVINKLRLAIDFGKRNFYVGQGEWEETARSSWAR